MQQELLNLMPFANTSAEVNTNSAHTNLLDSQKNADKFTNMLKNANDSYNKLKSKNNNIESNNKKMVLGKNSSKNQAGVVSRNGEQRDKQNLKGNIGENASIQKNQSNLRKKQNDSNDSDKKAKESKQKESNDSNISTKEIKQKGFELTAKTDEAIMLEKTLLQTEDVNASLTKGLSKDLLSEEQNILLTIKNNNLESEDINLNTFKIQGTELTNEDSKQSLSFQEIGIIDMVMNTDKYIKAFYESSIDTANIKTDIGKTGMQGISDELLNLEAEEKVSSLLKDSQKIVDKVVQSNTDSEDKSVAYKSEQENGFEGISQAKESKLALQAKDMKEIKSNLKTVEEEKRVISEDIKNVVKPELIKEETTKAKGFEEVDFQEEKSGEYLVGISEKVADKTADTQKVDKAERAKEALKKAGLSVEDFDTLNVKVESVSTSSSSTNNGNYLNQQSTHEQILKDSLQNAVQDKSLMQNTEKLSSKDFQKTLDVTTKEEMPKDTSKADILNQVQDKMQTMNKNGVSKIQIALTPEKLGKINIEIIQSKEGVSAKMIAETAQVKEVLEKNLDSLKSGLASQGVNVNNITVKVAGTNSSNTSGEAFAQEKENFSEERHQESMNFGDTKDFEDESKSNLQKEIEQATLEEESETEEVVEMQLKTDLSEEETEDMKFEKDKVDLQV